MSRLDTSSITEAGYDLPAEIAATVRDLDVDDLDLDLIFDAEDAIEQYAAWLKTAYTESGHYVKGDMIGRQEEDRHIDAIRAAVDALVAARKRADTPDYIDVTGIGGTIWAVDLVMQDGRRLHCGTFDYGEIDDHGQWCGDDDELVAHAVEAVRASRIGSQYDIPDDIEVQL